MLRSHTQASQVETLYSKDNCNIHGMAIFFQDAGVEGGKVGFPSNISLESLRRGEIATENKI